MRTTKFNQNLLYISYDGILDSIGESQILSYLEKLSNTRKIFLLSFEKKENFSKIKTINLKDKLKNKNIFWFYCTYHKSPFLFAKLYDIFIGICYSLKILLKQKIEIIHLRSYIPGLMVFFIFFFNYKIIFDIRGFWPDEKVDRSNWSKKGFLYIFFKFYENFLFKNSNAIICLTMESKQILLKKNYLQNKLIKVVPTCTDPDKFKIIKNKYKLKKNINYKYPIIFGYLGSVHTAYDIVPIIKLLKELIKINSNINLHFFNTGSHNYIKTKLAEQEILKKNYNIFSLNRNNISEFLNKIDIGILYAKENFSIKASFPTKIAEFLMCGKPFICNKFNNDIFNLIKFNQIGLIYNFKNDNYNKIYNDILDLLKKKDINIRCRKVAVNELSLNKAIKEYNKLYNQIIHEN